MKRNFGIETNSTNTSTSTRGQHWRERSLEFGRTNTAWLGELMLVYAPVAIIMLMILATMSFVLGNGIATNQRFELAWAWASALSVDGVMLALVVRAARPEKSWRYAVTLLVLVPMIAVGVALLALVTMQQTLRIDSEQLAIHRLGIDPTLLVLGRAGLTMFAALVGLVFSHMRPKESHSVSPDTVSVSPGITQAVSPVSPDTNQLIPPAPPDTDGVIPATKLLPIVAASKSQYDTVKAHYQVGLSLTEIADAAGVSLSTVKRHSRRIKQELLNTTRVTEEEA